MLIISINLNDLLHILVYHQTHVSHLWIIEPRSPDRCTVCLWRVCENSCYKYDEEISEQTYCTL